MTIYENGLSANRANYAPLTPVDFLDRAATTWPQKVAIIHGDIRRTYLEFNRRCRQMASALDRRGFKRGCHCHNRTQYTCYAGSTLRRCDGRGSIKRFKL